MVVVSGMGLVIVLQNQIYVHGAKLSLLSFSSPSAQTAAYKYIYQTSAVSHAREKGVIVVIVINMATADVISGVMGKELYKKKMKPNSVPVAAAKSESAAAAEADKTTDGLSAYYETKIGELQMVVTEKVQNLRRLQAQRNELNAKVRLLREEIQLLQEQGSYVGEVVKPMDKKKVYMVSTSCFDHCPSIHAYTQPHGTPSALADL